MTNLMAWAIVVLAHGGNLHTRLTVEKEAVIILNVARQYALTEEQTKLLVSIRRCENGSAGREMGVETDRAKRLASSPAASLRLQARYAAGTIKDHFTGDVVVFGQRYCPKNAMVWSQMVSQYLLMKEDQQ